MNKLPKDTMIAQTKDQVSCDMDGEAVILNHRKGVYYGLDPVGSTIWNLLQKPIRVEEIQNQLLQSYDVEPARCGRDLLKLLKKLMSEGLVEIHE